MTKSEAVLIFGTVGALAAALEVTPQAIYQWDEVLPQDRADRVLGAAMRTGKVGARAAASLAAGKPLERAS